MNMTIPENDHTTYIGRLSFSIKQRVRHQLRDLQCTKCLILPKFGHLVGSTQFDIFSTAWCLLAIFFFFFLFQSLATEKQNLIRKVKQSKSQVHLRCSLGYLLVFLLFEKKKRPTYNRVIGPSVIK